MEEIESDVSSLLENTSVDEFFQVLSNPEHDNHSVLRPYFDKIHEKQALYDDQADNYLDEYYAYHSNLK